MINIQVVERKALSHLSFAREFYVAIHFLSNGILEPNATYRWRRRNSRFRHFNRASPANMGPSQRSTLCDVETCSRPIGWGCFGRENRQALVQLHLWLRIRERHFTFP